MNGFSSAQAIHDRQVFAARQSELAALLAQPRREAPRPQGRQLSLILQRLSPLRSRGECGGAAV